MRSKTTGLVNISNHAVAGWSAEQRASAEFLVGGPGVELPEALRAQLTFAATACADEVVSVARTVAEHVVASGHGWAHVSGEPSFLVACVALLQRAGVRCVQATTERQSREVAQPDGSVHKESVFRFAQWREFPDVRGLVG